MRFLFTFIIIVFFVSCSNNHIEVRTIIDKIDTTGIYFKYEINDSIYDARFELDVTNDSFYESDSLIVLINSKEPNKPKYKYTIPKLYKEETVVATKDKNKKYKLYGYYSVETKPIIYGGIDSFDNDSIINVYFNDFFGKEKNKIKVNFYIRIDGSGDAHLDSHFSKDKKLINNIQLGVKNLPRFKPAIHNGDTVSVSFLVETYLPED